MANNTNKIVKFNDIQVGNSYRLIDINTRRILNLSFTLTDYDVKTAIPPLAKFKAVINNPENRIMQGKITIDNDGRTSITFTESPFNDNNLTFYLGIPAGGGRRRTRKSRKSKKSRSRR